MSLFAKIRWFFVGTDLQARRARLWGKIIFLLVLFSFLFWFIPFEEVFHALLSANPLYLLLGFFLAFISVALTALELEPLVRTQSIKRNVFQILQINLSVKFYLLFTPSTLVGSGYRWYRLSQPEGMVAESLAALGFFRLLEDFLTISLGLSFWLMSGGKGLQINLGLVAILILGIILIWFLATRASLPLYRWLKPRTTRFWDHPFWRKIIRQIEKLLIAVSVYADIPAMDLFIAIFGGIGSMLIGIVSALFLARSIGIQLSFLQMGWINSIVLIATQLPFTVAGGLGIREVTLVAILPGLGVSAELALAFSFLLFIRGIVLALVGGLSETFRTIRKPKLIKPDVDATQRGIEET